VPSSAAAMPTRIVSQIGDVLLAGNDEAPKRANDEAHHDRGDDAALYRWARRAVTTLLFERRYGVHTEDHVTLDELGVAASERRDYVPSGWLSLRRILSRREVSPDDVFLDVGAGMGRVVVQAAMSYRFRRVSGVELSPQLHAIAESNFARSAPRLRILDVSLVCADAAEFLIPGGCDRHLLVQPVPGGNVWLFPRSSSGFDQQNAAVCPPDLCQPTRGASAVGDRSSAPDQGSPRLAAHRTVVVELNPDVPDELNGADTRLHQASPDFEFGESGSCRSK
jgi:hypothetical protein